MFRTAMASISLYGVTFFKGVSASTNEIKQETIVIQSDKRHTLGEFFQDLEKPPVGSQFMAEPLTDQELLEATKDDMKTKMELMVMRVQKEFCEALEQEEDPRYRFQVIVLCYIYSRVLFRILYYGTISSQTKMTFLQYAV